MIQWDFSEIKSGIEAMLSGCFGYELTIHKMFFETTKTQVFEVIGESKRKEKVKGGKFWSVRANSDNTFQLLEILIMYGEEPLESESFVKEDYHTNKSEGNLAYATVIKDWTAKNIAKRKEKRWSKRNPHSYVILELRNDGLPVVKRVTFEDVYYLREIHSCKKELSNIADVPCDFREIEYDSPRLYELDNCPDMYGEKNQLTKLHVKADAVYDAFDGKKKVHRINRVYDSFYAFSEDLYNLEKDLGKKNIKDRWYQLAGMDIEKMDRMRRLSEQLFSI